MLAELIGQERYDARRGVSPRSAEELALLVLAVEEALASLPEDLRDLAERLKSRSLSQVARELGVPRSTLQDRVQQLLEAFECAGLRDFLNPPPSSGSGPT
jgi:DNA-directed RNA polymerase specialized sigma24 family protein